MSSTLALGGVPGVLTSNELAMTGAYLAGLQRPNGQIPWFEEVTATRGITSKSPWPSR